MTARRRISRWVAEPLPGGSRSDLRAHYHSKFDISSIAPSVTSIPSARRLSADYPHALVQTNTFSQFYNSLASTAAHQTRTFSQQSPSKQIRTIGIVIGVLVLVWLFGGWILRHLFGSSSTPSPADGGYLSGEV